MRDLVGLLILAAALVPGSNVWGEVIHLRNGNTIAGRILEQTAAEYRIEISHGAVVSVPVEQVSRVEQLQRAEDIPSLDVELDDILPKVTPKAVGADLGLASYESRLAQVKPMDDLIRAGGGIPDLMYPFQLNEARERKLPQIRFLGQMFYLSPEGKYSASRGFTGASEGADSRPQGVDPLSMFAPTKTPVVQLPLVVPQPAQFPAGATSSQ
jgi:hypothetical protein